MPAKGTSYRTKSLLAIFALADCGLKFLVNIVEGQNIGLAFLNAVVSSITCLSVIVVLIAATGRTHLLLYCGVYYALTFLLFLVLGQSVGASIDHGTTPILREGRWTLNGIMGLAMEMAGSIAVSFAVLSTLLFVCPRTRAGTPTSS